MLLIKISIKIKLTIIPEIIKLSIKLADVLDKMTKKSTRYWRKQKKFNPIDLFFSRSKDSKDALIDLKNKYMEIATNSEFREYLKNI